VYIHQNTLFAAPANGGTLALKGAARPVIEDVATLISGAAFFDLSGAPSGSGTLVYASGAGGLPMSIFWLDRTGKTQLLHAAPGPCIFPRFSPDGKLLAFVGNDTQGHQDLWVKDLEHDTSLRLTVGSGVAGSPVWTSDGRNIVFASTSPAPDIYWIRADGSSGEAQPLTNGNVTDLPNSFSPDGKRLAIWQPHAPFDVWTAPVEGAAHYLRLGSPEPFLRGRLHGFGPRFSPDGRWVAYSSNETGTSEVYVRPFPGPGPQIRISTGGGQWPMWSHNRDDLFFVGPDRRIMLSSYTANADSFSRQAANMVREAPDGTGWRPCGVPRSGSRRQTLRSRSFSRRNVGAAAHHTSDIPVEFR
jgi:Tol biopolymer transport system component